MLFSHYIVRQFFLSVLLYFDWQSKVEASTFVVFQIQVFSPTSVMFVNQTTSTYIN